MTRPTLEDAELLRVDAFINGRWQSLPDTFLVKNPSTGSPLVAVANGSRELTREAIEVASAAFASWRRTPAKERSEILRRWFEAVVAAEDDLALLMTLEQGKPLHESRAEVRYGAAFLEWFSEEARRIYGDTLPAEKSDRRMMVLKEPVGVVGAITPWNFPIAMITRKAAAALAAGCTIVVKPAEDTPLCALALAELARRVGVPAGVFNVIPTAEPNPVGHELCTHPLVRKLTFTGSTKVGQALLAKCAPTVKRVTMELGGNAPFIVFEDADLDAAVHGAIAAKFRNAGQTCICANRLLVQASVHDTFVEKLVAAVKQLVVGDGRDPAVHMGPLIHEEAAHNVLQMVETALDGGAQLAIGGQYTRRGAPFVSPTVLTQVRPEMSVSAEEIFGPVAPVTVFQDEKEAIEIANGTPYGLAAYVYARDIGRVWRVMESLEYGMVAINTGTLSTEVAPFGGMKQSGLGREGSHYGIDEYVEIKYGVLGGLDT
ncbi:MAG: NAD-dependent succinate-semialdehyde dehydrogenase [Myxococcales bacterium]|nr:NAD-dependent succinate-semialdehyde dehydrogenase [Myxococcales bacterium]